MDEQLPPPVRDRRPVTHRDDSGRERRAAALRGDPPGVPTVAALRIVLVDDDPGDAVVVRELLERAGGGYELVWCRTPDEGLARLDRGADCVLIDLGPPGRDAPAVLRAVVDHPSRAAVVVLTRSADRSMGSDAVLLGAQDHLVKGRLDHESLARAIRYAIARRQSQESSRQVVEALLLSAESARMERGLVARPLIEDHRFHWAVRYQAGGRRALLGGDFFDAIELPDGRWCARLLLVRIHAASRSRIRSAGPQSEISSSSASGSAAAASAFFPSR